MSVLADFACSECGSVSELWVANPIPSERPCPRCGCTARRRFGGPGLLGRGGERPAHPVPPGPAPTCRQFPQIPGMCHLTPSARRRAVAAYLGDHRGRDREIARQQAGAANAAPTMASAISPHHTHP